MIAEYRPEIRVAPLVPDKGGNLFHRLRWNTGEPVGNAMVLYRAEDGAWIWAMFRCPCGCGHPVYMPLQGNPKNYPARWTLTMDAEGRVTIRNSVQRMVTCNAHFYITENKPEML